MTKPEPDQPPIHVIDVQELYGTVTQRDLCAQHNEIPFREMCKRLSIYDTIVGWSAGKDAE